MRSLAFATVASFSLLVVASAQQTPDFSGNWHLDAARSDGSAYASVPGPVTLEIAQTPTEIQITTSTPRGATTTRYAIREAVRGGAAGAAVARWQGGALITDAVREIRGQSVTVQQSRRLSDDGGEMIVETVVNVQHGYSVTGGRTYGTSRDVFVRR